MRVSLILLCAMVCVSLAGASAMADWGTQIWPSTDNTVSAESPYYAYWDDSGTDNLWEYYWPFHGNVWVSCSDAAYMEDSPMLTTTITGLDSSKVYDVRVLYFDRTLDENLPGVIMAAIHDEPLIRCDASNGILEATYGSIRLFTKYIGQALYSPTVSVDIDDVTDGSGRAMYAFLQYNEGIPPAITATPAFDPNVGMLSGPTAITITCATAGATIRYTLDGTTPSETNGLVIASGSSVSVSPGQTLSAKAWSTDLPSAVKTVSFGAWGTEVWPSPDNTTSLAIPYYAGDAIDNLWEYYWPYHGHVWVSCSDAKYREDSPLITTTVTGLDDTKVYDVYVCFFERTLSDNLPGVIMAGMHGEPLIRCDRTNSEFEITYQPENIERYRKLIGQASYVSSFSVDIDDVSDGSGRAYYAFVEYKEGTPPGLTALPTFSPDGGMIFGPREVMISCATVGATIRYTLDGSVPSETNGTVIASGSSVTVAPGQTLKAMAWSSDLPPSPIKSASYTQASASNFNRPLAIDYSNSVVVDGNLSEWSADDFVPLDKVYDGAPSDIQEAKYAAKWGADGNKVYVAVKVRDTAHAFTDTYTGWNTGDHVELYIHTTNPGGVAYSGDQASAQQYNIGIKNSDRAALWSVIGNGPIPSDSGFEAAGREGTGADAGWLFYEAAITPYHTFSLNAGGKTISQLHAGDVIGLDVVALGCTPTYTGMVSENAMTGKYNDWTKFGQHLLVQSGSVANAKHYSDYTAVQCTGIVSAAFTDHFYIESADRSSGVRVVKTAHGLVAGQIVIVTGYTQTLASGEKAIVALTVNDTQTTATIAPLGVVNKVVGGGNAAGQVGVVNGFGLNNIGLFVRTTGYVSNASGTTFRLDDGSGVNVKAVITGSVTLPANNSYVAVDGIVSCEKDAGQNIQPILLVTGKNVVATP